MLLPEAMNEQPVSVYIQQQDKQKYYGDRFSQKSSQNRIEKIVFFILS